MDKKLVNAAVSIKISLDRSAKMVSFVDSRRKALEQDLARITWKMNAEELTEYQKRIE